MIQKLLFSVTTALALVAGPSALHAAACGPDRDADIPIFEDLKSLFIEGDYAGYIDKLGPLYRSSVSDLNQQMVQFGQVFPNGFDVCETVLQRREAPGFSQDIIVFSMKDSPDELVAMHLVGIRVAGKFTVASFNFNTDLGLVFGGLH
ncbi:MAG: hypothetical protein AAFQ64_15545 [Pseudomonadota bacterium]